MSTAYPTSRRVLDFIREYYTEHKIPPTMIEIGRGTGIKSTSTTYYHIIRLSEDGYIDRMQGAARGTIPTEKKIDTQDFAQYKPTKKVKINPSDPYGGDYGNHNGSIRQAKQGAKARRSTGHKQPAAMPDPNACNLDSGREHHREDGSNPKNG